MLRRQEAELGLGPLLPARAEQAARADGDLRLHLLVARGERIAGRVDEPEDALLLITLESELPERGGGAEPEHADAGPGPRRDVHQRQQRQPDEQRQDRDAEILLQHDQPHRHADDQARQEEVAQPPDLRRGIASEIMREADHHPDLRELGRLQPTGEEPGAGAAGLLGDREGEQQQADGGPVDAVGVSVEMPVVDRDDDADHDGREPEHRELTPDDVRTALDAGRRRGHQVHDPRRREQHDDRGQHPVEMRHPAALHAHRTHRIPSEMNANSVGTRPSFFEK